MPALAIAAVLSLASLHAPQVAPETLTAFAQAESALDPLAIHDNFDGRRYSPRSLNGAIVLARGLLREGRSIDCGLLQLNSTNFPKLGLTVEEAFDPVISIKAGARIMVAAYQQCLQTLKAEAALKCMASIYNTGNGQSGIENGYQANVWHVADQLVPAIRDARQHELPFPDASPPPVEDRGLHDAVHVHRAPSPPERKSS